MLHIYTVSLIPNISVTVTFRTVDYCEDCVDLSDSISTQRPTNINVLNDPTGYVTVLRLNLINNNKNIFFIMTGH